MRLVADGDMRNVCVELAARRGREIVLSPLTMPTNAIHAVLVRTADIDYIVYERDTTWLHQQLLIAHELSHLICEHRGALDGAADTGAALLPDLDPEQVVDALGRGDYGPEQELEAETMATLLLERQRLLSDRQARSCRTHAMGQALGFEAPHR
ncbi:hypothetical protein [Nocardia sp. NPDC052566]|uniref:hypothetical protein n=1 Tax=Nocardia sp. NPDC052566 TaxID=3364330 RepID=UPI0037C91F7E